MQASCTTTQASLLAGFFLDYSKVCRNRPSSTQSWFDTDIGQAASSPESFSTYPRSTLGACFNFGTRSRREVLAPDTHHAQCFNSVLCVSLRVGLLRASSRCDHSYGGSRWPTGMGMGVHSGEFNVKLITLCTSSHNDVVGGPVHRCFRNSVFLHLTR